METVEMLVKKYSKMGTAQVLAQMSRVKGNARIACIEILKKRGQDTSEWDSEGLVETVAAKQEKIKHSPSGAKKTVYEAEPETELTRAERRLIENSEKEREEDDVSMKFRSEKSKVKVQKSEKQKTNKIGNKLPKSKFTESDLFTVGDIVNTKNKSGEEVSGIILKIDKDKDDNFWLQIRIGEKTTWRQQMKCWK